jgi:hypothetical protein
MDIRNFISMAVMNKCRSENLSSHCIGNFDSSKFLLTFNNKEDIISVNKDSPATRMEEYEMDLFVKQYFLVNAVGFSAPPLFVLSADFLKEDNFVILEIEGLSFSFDSNSIGYLVFCNSRTGNTPFYRWLFMEYVVKNIQIFKSRQETSSNFYLVLDGEANQIQTLDNPDIRALLNTHTIDIGKGPASCSGCCGNALDCGNFFKAIKTSLRGNNAVGQQKSFNSELEDKIFNRIKNNPILSVMSADRRSKISKAIVYLWTFELRSLNLQIFQNSFETIGILGENRVERTLALCSNYNSINKNQLESIKSSMDQLVSLFNSHGEIKDSDYDGLNIMRTEGNQKELNKDELIIYRQRAVLLTHAESIARREKRMEDQRMKQVEGEKKKKENEEKKEKRKEKKEEKEKEKKRKLEIKEEESRRKQQKLEEKKVQESRKASLRVNKTSKKKQQKRRKDKKKS